MSKQKEPFRSFFPNSLADEVLSSAKNCSRSRDGLPCSCPCCLPRPLVSPLVSPLSSSLVSLLALGDACCLGPCHSLSTHASFFVGFIRMHQACKCRWNRCQVLSSHIGFCAAWLRVWSVPGWAEKGEPLSHGYIESLVPPIGPCYRMGSERPWHQNPRRQICSSQTCTDCS